MADKPPEVCIDCGGRVKWGKRSYQPDIGYFHLGICPKCGVFWYYYDHSIKGDNHEG